jgi:hypothetical protein
MDDVAEYCRQIEEHLTRVNEGNLVRIVGQSFAMVRGWALEGVPLSVACEGITRKAERHRAGRSSRPLRLEFCEADVRAAYDAWRRAVGVPAARLSDGAGEASDATPAAERRRPSLAKELGRAIDRLSSVAGRLDVSEGVRDALTAVLGQLIALRDEARGARQAARAAAAEQLAVLDRQLLEAAQEAAGPARIDRFRADAARDLDGYRARLSPEAWTVAVERGTHRLLREWLGLPVLDPDA